MPLKDPYKRKEYERRRAAEMIRCSCGIVVRKGSIWSHRKTKKHARQLQKFLIQERDRIDALKNKRQYHAPYEVTEKPFRPEWLPISEFQREHGLLI